MRSCFTSFHKRVYNLVSPTTIEVESAHSVVYLLQRSTLIGVNLHKKLGKCSQRSLKEDNPVGGVLFYKFKVFVSSLGNSPVVPRLERNSARSTAQLRTVWPQGAALEEVFTSTAKLWLVYVIREKLWKLLKWTVSFGWKKINLRLTVSKDFNGSMLVEKIIAHRKGPFKLRKWTKNKNLWSGSGLAGINRRDYGT